MLSEGVTLILRGFAPDKKRVEERPTEHVEDEGGFFAHNSAVAAGRAKPKRKETRHS